MDNILFVFEGQNAEDKITANLREHFFSHKSTIHCAYGTTIYGLYKEIFKDTDLDTFEVLKARVKNKEVLAPFKRDDFAEIYLFFDYDGHTTNASDEKMSAMLELFKDETEFGKLFVSYPMVEALKHYSEAIDFKLLKVKAKEDTAYKKQVNQVCDREIINMPLYTRDTWRLLIEIHLKKMNYIVTENYDLPTSLIFQKIIFSHQLEKYIKKDSSVAVLSAFPIFLFDYFGYKYIANLLAEKDNSSISSQ